MSASQDWPDPSRPDLDETHDPARRSFVDGANDPGSEFPIQNLPYGSFVREDEATPRVGVAIGNHLLDLGACLEHGLLRDECALAAQSTRGGLLNDFMGLQPRLRRALRRRISELLTDGNDEIEATGAVDQLLPRRDSVEMVLPVRIGDYTDFYASVHHATNVGSMFRPDNPLLPNYKWIPVGYHGRASSVVVSGTPVRRPRGQTLPDGAEVPTFGPSRLLDYELELGFFVGTANGLGQPVPIARAEDHLFGICLVNDWSARDIQKWEYQPLGPFLSKSFATSVSPWIVPWEALAPFRCPAFERPEGDPQPLPHLLDEEDRRRGGLDVSLEVYLLTPQMREKGLDPHRLSTGSYRWMYWTPAQMLAHHTSNGCNLRPGDLFASGTVSGPAKENRGCLLELTWRGTEPIDLPGGEQRRFLQDGDELVLRGRCEAEGFVGIGLGECRGRVVGVEESLA